MNSIHIFSVAAELLGSDSRAERIDGLGWKELAGFGSSSNWILVHIHQANSHQLLI